KDSYIFGLNNSITEFKQEIRNKDSHIDGLNNFIDEFKQDIQNKNAQIYGLNKFITEFKQEIQSKDACIQQTNTSIEEFKKEIKLKDELITQNQKELDEIYKSLFWKIYKKFPRTLNMSIPRNAQKRVFSELLQNINIINYENNKECSFPVIKTDLLSSEEHSSKIPLPLLKKLNGKFKFTENNLCELKFFTATYQRINSDLELKVINESGKVLRKSRVKGQDILDNDYTSFKFKPIKDSKEKKFSFELFSKSPSAAVWFNDSKDLKDIKLVYDNKALKGSIGFQACSNIAIEGEYDLWMQNNNLTVTELEQYKLQVKELNYKPKISIIMPVYNVDQIWLKKAIDSVRNQLYDNWELCIADDASTKEHIKPILDGYSEKDDRIKIKYLINNLGISGASNEALSLSTGEFIGLLDNDDELSVDALFEVVKVINEKPETDLVYSDEDKISMEGKCSNPFFKPDWSPDLLLAVNYFCHFTVIRKKIVEEVGQFGVGFEGSQDYDLFLRVIEKTSNIEHIPKILYHWRMIPSSTAANISIKDYAHTNGVKALQNHLLRQKIEGDVVDSPNRTNYIVEYKIKNDPLVSIIIPFKDKVEYLKKCLNSIEKYTTDVRYEILLVSNNSQKKETFQYLNSIQDKPNVQIIMYDKPFNFAAINNFASKKSIGSYLLFLNNDTEVITDNWLLYLLMNAQRKEIGCVGAKLLYPDGTIQHAGVILGLTGMAGHVLAGLPENKWTNLGLDSWSRNYLAVTAACLMISKEKFDQVGGFDEKFTICGNDVDLCLKVHRLGYRNLYVPHVKLYHYESISRGKEIPVCDFQESWKSYKYFLENGDPFYNPNLTLENTSCSLNKHSKCNYDTNITQTRKTLLKMGCRLESNDV
ncbi:MAG: hypothetical protein QG646_4331, partial [Euryarchaeota archaeon]|nr:hypothetical protein [Euryarchaeota archaeon]